MVDTLGHVAVGLLWALPAWVVWERRATFGFLGFVLLTVVVPDVDLYLPGIPHHGVTHTVLFVATLALVGGALVTRYADDRLRRWLDRSDGPAASRISPYAYVTAGLLLGGLSHVFVDLLSTSHAERVVEPFWPLVEKPFSVLLIPHYSAPVWNGGLLLVALSFHGVLFALDATPARRIPPADDR